MKQINRFSSIILIAFLFLFAGCKKVEHAISEQIVSINEATVNSIQVGNKLKVSFITNNVSTFDFSIMKDGTALFTETISVPLGQMIVDKVFDIPMDDNWVGEALLTVKYNDETKTKPIIFEESNPTMYLVGGSTGAGWEPTLATPMTVYDTESKTKFETYEFLESTGGGFKFVPTNVDWVNAFGLGSVPLSLLQDKDADNLPVTKDGFYRIRMDSQALTYELFELSMGIIGNATAGGWDADTDMTFVGGKGTYVWRVTANLVPGELKFRANKGWTINFGGTEDNIVFDGSNIAIASAGTYLIELNLKPGAYTAVIKKQ